jgi:hypothetical protein
MLNSKESRIESSTQKQIIILTRAEELMTSARQIFQNISQQPKSKDFTKEIGTILNQCERAAQIVDQISPKEIVPERLHMTQSVKNSITSQTIFYMKWIADYMEGDQITDSPQDDSDNEESFKYMLATLCQSERELVSSYENHKKSEGLKIVLGIYRKLLFSLIDFFEGYIANQFEMKRKELPKKGKP